MSDLNRAEFKRKPKLPKQIPLKPKTKLEKLVNHKENLMKKYKKAVGHVKDVAMVAGTIGATALVGNKYARDYLGVDIAKHAKDLLKKNKTLKNYWEGVTKRKSKAEQELMKIQLEPKMKQKDIMEAQRQTHLKQRNTIDDEHRSNKYNDRTNFEETKARIKTDQQAENRARKKAEKGD